MARLSISILSHQQRDDLTYPISISLSHLGKTAYIPTGRSAHVSQVISKRGTKTVYEIRDRKLQRELLDMIEIYERELSNISLVNQSARELVQIILSQIEIRKKDGALIDFISFARTYVDKITPTQPGSAANFRTLLNSLEDYLNRPVLYTKEISLRFLGDFRAFLCRERIISRRDQFGVIRKRNVPRLGDVALYGRLKDFRTLFYHARRTYNDEDSGLILIPHNPFRNLNLSQPATLSRAIGIREINLLYLSEYILHSREELGRDMFFLSFFLMGINAVDLYSIDKKGYKGDRIIYNRAKTKGKRKDKAICSVKVERIVIPLINKYRGRGDCLFSFSQTYSCRTSFTRAINSGLRSLCTRNNLPIVTMYVARHSFATYARNDCGISKDIISLMLNHSSVDKTERVTDIYLRKDLSLIDRANSKVISSFVSQLSSFATTSPPG